MWHSPIQLTGMAMRGIGFFVPACIVCLAAAAYDQGWLRGPAPLMTTASVIALVAAGSLMGRSAIRRPVGFHARPWWKRLQARGIAVGLAVGIPANWLMLVSIQSGMSWEAGLAGATVFHLSSGMVARGGIAREAFLEFLLVTGLFPSACKRMIGDYLRRGHLRFQEGSYLNPGIRVAIGDHAKIHWLRSRNTEVLCFVLAAIERAAPWSPSELDRLFALDADGADPLAVIITASSDPVVSGLLDRLMAHPAITKRQLGGRLIDVGKRLTDPQPSRTLMTPFQRTLALPVLLSILDRGVSRWPWTDAERTDLSTWIHRILGSGQTDLQVIAFRIAAQLSLPVSNLRIERGVARLSLMATA
jgi:hypothetical protein